MLVKDAATWQQRRADLVSDGPTGEMFLRFVETWAEHAEGAMEHVKLGLSPVAALHHTLRMVEEEISRCDVIFMGQMLAVLAMYWIHGEKMMAELTPIEERLVQDVTIMKIRHEQMKAAQVSPGA